MSVSYAKLKLKTDVSTTSFDFNGETIEVLNYLPIEEKNDIIKATLIKSAEENTFNPLLLDMYFHLHLVYSYCNLSFTEKQKEDEFRIYDRLKSNGFIDQMLGCINKDEYTELLEMIEQFKHDIEVYGNSAGNVIKAFINELPNKAQEAKEIMDDFDLSKYQEAQRFATAIGQPLEER